jgi:hypothetical protein
MPFGPLEKRGENVMARLSEYATLPMAMAFVGCILAAGGALWGGIRANHEKKESERKQLDFQNELRSKNEELRALGEKNAELNEYIRQYLTGGDSYCCVGFSNLGDDVIRASVRHVGQYPVYSVEVILDDMDNWGDSDTAHGDLFPGRGLELSQFSVKGKKLVRMRAVIGARNGVLMQMVHGRKIGKLWQFATQLTRCYPENALIAETIPDGFPKTKDGKYDWNCRE